MPVWGRPRAALGMRLAALTLLVACPIGEGPDALEAGPDDGLRLGQSLVYTLDWDREGVTLHETGWSAINDLGFEFEFQQAFATTYSLELVPCDPVSRPDGGLGDLVERVLGWIGPRKAFAGHGGAPFNPTRLGQSLVESIHGAVPFVSAPMTADGNTYCQFHYLVARAHGGTQQLPETLDYLGRSAILQGRWRQADGPWQDFDWRSEVPWGEMKPLEPAVADGPLSADAPTQVLVTRPLHGLLRALDPVQMRPEVLANTVIKNMVQGTRIEIRTAHGRWRSQP